MSIFGIASSILGQIGSATTQNANKQQFKHGFPLLGQDLQSGNLSQAQSDFASLQQLLPSRQQSSLLAPASSTQSSNPLATAVSQLAQDLKSGNLTAARSDFATVQQDLQQAGPQLGAGHARTILTTATPAPANRPASRTPSPRSSANWDRISRAEICLPPSRHTRLSSRTCNNSHSIIPPRPAGHHPPHWAQTSASPP